MAHGRDQHTHRRTSPLCTVGGIYAVHAMQPDDDVCYLGRVGWRDRPNHAVVGVTAMHTHVLLCHDVSINTHVAALI